MAYTAVSSVLIGLLFAAGSNTSTTALPSECAYLQYNFIRSTSRLPSLLPSVSGACLTGNRGDYCNAACQSLHSLYSQCASSGKADVLLSYRCGEYQDLNCIALHSLSYEYVDAVRSACNDASRCSPACEKSVSVLEAYTGCCSADILNGPKVLCGQRPIAPCSTPLNTPALPSGECAYFDYYVYSGNYRFRPHLNASLLPSVRDACVSVLADEGLTSVTCTRECQSLYDLIGRCYGVQQSYDDASRLCGAFNGVNCSSLRVDPSVVARIVYSECSDSAHCSPSCLSIITSMEQYGGCCYAPYLNGAKVLCGQQPIADCPTVFRQRLEGW